MKIDVNDANGRVTLTFDESDAKGEVTLEAGAYGPTLYVNGRPWGFIDLYEASPLGSGGPAQILLADDPASQEPLVKLVLDPVEPRIVVSADAELLSDAYARAIHNRGDRVYRIPASS